MSERQEHRQRLNARIAYAAAAGMAGGGNIMERLTYFENGEWRMDFNGCQYQANFVDRLAAYEDTGLTPEQCENAKTIIESAFSDDTSKAERIRELLKADKDGRLVVLPCKVGDTVYKIFKERTKCSAYGECFSESSCCGCECKCDSTIQYVIRPIQATTLSSLALYIGDIGKTVFLTREEAEAALKEAQK